MLKEASNHSQIQLLRRANVEAITGLKRSTIYAMVKKGVFPPPVKITTKAVGWKYNDISRWIDTLNTASPLDRGVEVSNGKS